MKVDKAEIKRYIYNHISIQDPSGGDPLPMRFNQVQCEFYDSSKAFLLMRYQDYVVKPRQVGFSTLNMCFIAACMVLYPGFNALWVSEDQDNARVIRRKRNKIFDSLMIALGSGVTRKSFSRYNDEEIVLQNGSSLSMTYAGNSSGESGNSTGRGDTLMFAVLSESAYWKGARQAYDSLMPGAELAKPSIVWDSTPNGTVGDGEFFYTRIMSVLEGTMTGKVYFWPWWKELRYAIPASATEVTHIQKTLSGTEKELTRDHGLSWHQIKWRRAKILDMSGDLQKFRESYIETLEDAFIIPGKTVFNHDRLRIARRRMAPLLKKRLIGIEPFLIERNLDMGGEFDPLLQFTTDPRVLNQARFYISPNNTAAGPFSLGGDTSGGVPGGDPCCFVIIDKDSKMAGIVRGLYTPQEQACIVSRLHELYNTGNTIEDQSTGPEIQRLLRGEMSESDIERLGLHMIMQSVITAHLERNNKKTRPMLIGTLLQFINKGLHEIIDPLILTEAQTFVRHDDGTIGHANNCHDDSLLALIMAIRGRERTLIESAILNGQEFKSDEGDSSHADRFGYINELTSSGAGDVKSEHAAALRNGRDSTGKREFGKRSRAQRGIFDLV